MTHTLDGRRKVRRVHARDEFLIEFRKSASRVWNKGYGADLSLTGASFSTLAKVKQGESLAMHMCLTPEFEESRELTMRAEVTHIKPHQASSYYSIGCRFRSLSRRTQQALQNFLNWIFEKQHRSQHRRSHMRVQADDQFLMEFQDGKQKPKFYHQGYGCDLSVKGARFATLAPVKIGQLLDMMLYFDPHFKGPNKIQLQGRVVRSYQPKGARYQRVACEFAYADPRDEEAVRQFLFWIETR